MDSTSQFFQSLCHSLCSTNAATTITFFGQHVTNQDADSEMSERLWRWQPQPSGCANIIRCSRCFCPTLHDFATDAVHSAKLTTLSRRTTRASHDSHCTRQARASFVVCHGVASMSSAGTVGTVLCAGTVGTIRRAGTPELRRAGTAGTVGTISRAGTPQLFAMRELYAGKNTRCGKYTARTVLSTR